MTKHAVWVNNRLATLEGVKNARVPQNFPDIFEMCHFHKVTHLWMNTSIRYTPWKSEGEWSFKYSMDKHENIKTASIWKRGVDHVVVIFPQYTSWYGTEKQPGWIRGATPREVLTTIEILEKELGVVIAGSPAGVGWALLKKIHPEWIEKIDVNLKDLHFTAHAGHDLIWQAQTLAPGHYIHKFDKNAAYPAAATSVDIGVGTPMHVDHGRDADHERGHPQAAGVWRCSVDSMPQLAPGMPPVWTKKEGWLAGPIIRLIRAAGGQVIVHEGYVFPQRHDVLVKWADLLWKKRVQYAGDPRVQRAFKQVANTTIGFTAFKGFEEDEDEKRRPDIRLQVVSRNREIMWHNINKVRELHGVTPFMVYMDAVYYVSDEQDGRKAFPALVNRKKNGQLVNCEKELGCFKWEGRIEITESVRNLLLGKGNEAGKLELLNVEGWTK